MATSLKISPALHRALFSNASSHQLRCRGKVAAFQVKAEALESLQQGSIEYVFRGYNDTPLHIAQLAVRMVSQDNSAPEKTGRRQALVIGATIATCITISPVNSNALAVEVKKGFQAVLDNKDGYSFLYPFGWQEVVIQGQDKVFKDVIEPLESVSVNIIETNKQDIRDLGSPQEVAEALIKKVLAPPSQKTKLIEASEHEVDGKVYYTFEFIAQAPNFTRHAVGMICIGNGKFYTLTTGANERRWEKMKDKLHTVIDSFKLSSA